MRIEEEPLTGKKILLILLPFWTPLIPPLGISCLKGFLQQRGMTIKTVDANVEMEFVQIYDGYLNSLKKYIPRENRGNFFNIGIDVLQNHLDAYFNYVYGKQTGNGEDDGQYVELLKQVISRTFFHRVDDAAVQDLDGFIAEFYLRLEFYLDRLMVEETPDVLGISVYKGTFAPSLFAFKRVKEHYPSVKTVMGGGIFSDQLALGSPNFDAFLEKTPYIDTVIVGEGELLFLKLLKGELPPSHRVYTRETLNGEVLDVSTAPVPDFSDFDTGYYSALPAYSSRSCPFQCGFCAETVNWGKYRKKSARRVAEELNRLYETYGGQLFLMCDSLLNPIVADLARELSGSETVLYWDGYLRVDKMARDIENTLSWRRGGFYRARLGIESGSDRILTLMDKKITTAGIRESLSNLAHAGIKTSTYWVVGYPGETEADFRETLALIERLKDDIYEAEANPFRFYPMGQVKSGEWAGSGTAALLYPPPAKELLTLQTWFLEDVAPSREEIYSRLSRFVAHCKKLGVPNPYSWQEINAADERWKKLHLNAVPPLMAFKDRETYLDECRSVENLLLLEETEDAEGDFDFG